MAYGAKSTFNLSAFLALVFLSTTAAAGSDPRTPGPSEEIQSSLAAVLNQNGINKKQLQVWGFSDDDFGNFDIAVKEHLVEQLRTLHSISELFLTTATA